MSLRVGPGGSVLLAIVLALICAVVSFAQAPLQLPPELRMMGYRTRTGETFRVRVKAATNFLGRDIWGTDVYTDDSDIEVAVIHAGLLTPGQEGDVLVTFLPGQNQYPGSTRNGVNTDTYDSWPASYRLAKADGAPVTIPALPPPIMPPGMPMMPPAGGANIVTFGPNGGISVTLGPNGVVTGGTNFFPNDEQTSWYLLGGQPPAGRGNQGPILMALRHRIGDSFEFEVTGTTSGGTVWGNGVYTDDSDLGMVAVHAGVLKPGERGRVRITVLPGEQSYPGTLQNGVRSQPYGSWDGSYRLDTPPAGTATPNIVTSISGLITDTNGRPLPNASVAAAATVFRDGRRTLAETNTTVTNANGEYSLTGMVPGNYLIVATPSRSTTTNPLPSYFPGVATPDTAAQIPIRGGEQVVSIDFTFAIGTLRKVTGKVSNAPPGGVQNLTFAQRNASKPSSAAAPLIPNASSNRTTGEFELMLPDGEWDVFPVIANSNPTNNVSGRVSGVPPTGMPAYTTGRVSVDVSGGSVGGINVALGSSDITGRLVLDPALRPSKMEIRLAAIDGTPVPLWQHAQSAPVSADNRFKISALPAGDYRIEVSPAIPNAYVSDIRVGQASIFNDGILHVKTETMEPVDVFLTSGGGTVQGEVRSASATASGRVVLVPAAPRRRNALLYKQESISGAGREFRFSNVPPGQYKVFAFDNLPIGAEMSAEFMSRYEELGEPVTVTAAGVARVTARVIEAEK